MPNLMALELGIIICPNCSSKNTKKYGIIKKKLQNTQRYLCNSCQKTFILETQSKNKTYPTRIILNTLSYYNLGHSQAQTSKIISQKHKTKVPQKTISNWLNEYKNICTFQKLRKEAKKLYPAEEIIEQHTLMHNNLPYNFQIHKAKLYLLFHTKLYNNEFGNNSKYCEPTKQYLEKIPTNKFPHHIFQPKQGEQEELNGLARSSQIKIETLNITKLQKDNFACKLASLALNLAATNKQRHEAIQNFFLINDSTTIAAEIPVYLTHDDIFYYKIRNFTIKFLEKYETPITGHIDLLQIRNGLIHILDYKPDSHLKQVQEHAVQQLTIYALALASRTKLDLASFKCAFFDENNYFEFFPLHCVYEKKIER